MLNYLDVRTCMRVLVLVKIGIIRLRTRMFVCELASIHVLLITGWKTVTVKSNDFCSRFGNTVGTSIRNGNT